MWRFLQSRSLNLIGAGIGLTLLGFAYFSEFALGLHPCPLCLFQRWFMWGLTGGFLLAAALGPGPVRSRLAGGVIALSAGIGAGIAGWHVRLQNLPEAETPASCGPNHLDSMVDMFGWGEALEMAFTASGDCAEVDWAFAGLSMPAWVLVWFLLLGGMGTWINWRAGRPPF